jgi:hypothetical protein
MATLIVWVRIRSDTGKVRCDWQTLHGRARMFPTQVARMRTRRRASATDDDGGEGRTTQPGLGCVSGGSNSSRRNLPLLPEPSVHADARACTSGSKILILLVFSVIAPVPNWESASPGNGRFITAVTLLEHRRAISSGL